VTTPRRKPFQLSLEELCLLAGFVADDIGFLLAPPQSLASPFASLCFVFNYQFPVDQKAALFMLTHLLCNCVWRPDFVA
jgi:hypothetical protein